MQLLIVEFFSSLKLYSIIGLVLKMLDFQSRGPVFKTAVWLQSRLSFLSVQGQYNEYKEFLGT